MIGRIKALDWSRGLLMMLMALDHASLYWNRGRIHDEGLNGLYPASVSWAQFLTRFISHPCAPGFIFISGFVLFISLNRQKEKEQTLISQSVHVLLRGLTLMALDFILINRFGWTFGVLACIGACMMLFAFLRFIPASILLPISITVLVFHPCISPASENSSLGSIYLAHAIAGTIRIKKNLAVLYPIIPWIGVMGLGFGLAAKLFSLLEKNKMLSLSKTFLLLGIFCLGLFFPARCFTADFYGDDPALQGILSQEFWFLSKYPPSLAFILWNMGLTCLLMGITFRLESSKYQASRFLNILQTFGQVPLFFYIIHRYFYALFPKATGSLKQYSLATTCLVWALGLIPLYILCKEYRKTPCLSESSKHKEYHAAQKK